MKRNCIHIMTLVLMTLVLGFAALSLAPAAAGMPEGQTSAAEGNEAAPPPRSPLRLSKVDFQETGEGGKLTLAGEALPGSDLYLFLDDEPFATVTPDGGGKWSFESAMKLDDGRHTLRADQYDQGHRDAGRAGHRHDPASQTRSGRRPARRAGAQGDLALAGRCRGAPAKD